MRVLLTGTAGFAGSHLAEYLVTQRALSGAATQPGADSAVEAFELHGVIHRHDRRIQNLRKEINLHRGDLRNALWVSELIQEVRPTMCCTWPHGVMWEEAGNSLGRPMN